ncbi:efflux RND transporter permease subunit [Coxiella endosymbiont of Ornithodoros maritimus]|uniref:efflux RND transporter permease subunit n=1 Tax=Coxiella endosymbiont of Ornithodoros maritimus TaxID=1656172 RepID=UPI002263B4C6|nr:efflux RND transporter permease subunit [Coxiella endosymbiont of Ornithodoros maritimus]
MLKSLPGLSQKLPGDAKLQVIYNKAVFIKSAIDDVELTLLFAVFLVTVVVYLFFRNFSLTTIAALSLSISVITTFVMIYLLSYSLDNLSLMALVLAVGFIIDDPIVVLENIVRYIKKGMDKFTTSLRNSKEVNFTVTAMTISLVSVFILTFFMGHCLVIIP